MLPEVGTQDSGRQNRNYIYLSLYTRWKHHSRSKIYVFDHGDTLNPVPCYWKSEPKMAAAQTGNTYISAVNSLKPQILMFNFSVRSRMPILVEIGQRLSKLWQRN